MNQFLKKHHRALFYGCWLLLGIFQSGLTELQDDEAYYWVYSRYLDWGYFDHPPMIGMLVKMGYAIFPNELGVRLFPLLLHVLSLVIIEKLTVKKTSLPVLLDRSFHRGATTKWVCCCAGHPSYFLYSIVLPLLPEVYQ